VSRKRPQGNERSRATFDADSPDFIFPALLGREDERTRGREDERTRGRALSLRRTVPRIGHDLNEHTAHVPAVVMDEGHTRMMAVARASAQSTLVSHLVRFHRQKCRRRICSFRHDAVAVDHPYCLPRESGSQTNRPMPQICRRDSPAILRGSFAFDVAVAVAIDSFSTSIFHGKFVETACRTWAILCREKSSARGETPPARVRPVIPGAAPMQVYRVNVYYKLIALRNKHCITVIKFHGESL